MQPRHALSTAMSTIARTLDEALAPITDGCMLAVPRHSFWSLSAI
jgi:hypothetical protein